MAARDQARSIWVDAICLGLITSVTALPYVAKLGFYSDDWYILWSFRVAELRHDFWYNAIVREFSDRPLQGLYLALQYKAFGFHPLRYHLIDTAVIAAGMPLAYWLLVRMKVDRASAFGATALLIALPQLSTVRAWYEASQIPLSMLLALVSLHCQLSFARTGRVASAVAAGLAAVLSIAAYELFAPLIAAFPVGLLAVQWRGRWRQLLASRRTLVLLALVLLVALAALAKYAVSPRPQPPDLHRYVKGLIQLVRPDYDWRTDYALNLFAAADVHFRWTVIGWARGVAALVRGELGWAEGGVAIAVALLLFWRLRSAGRLATGPWSAARLFLLGIAVFALGHAVFVIVPAMSFSPAGIANRALVAAAIGVALIFVAVMRLGVQLAPARMRSPVFAAALAAVAFLGTLRILEIEKYWTEAPAIQQKVLAAARLDLKGVPAGSSVMLDNVCPYHGSAVILEAPWDTSGALGLAIGKPLHADVVSRRMQLRPDGVATSIYGEPAFYPFGPNLYVYDPSRHLVVPLADLASAERYFRRAPRAACPEAYVGQGVLI